MPTYDYECTECGRIEEHIHGITVDPQIKCGECKSAMKKKFTPPQFIMKGGTEAINWREKRHRMNQRDIVGKKERERYGTGPRIKPNIAGVETGSWSDAQKMAKEAGMNHESYTPWVEKEKKNKIITS